MKTAIFSIFFGVATLSTAAANNAGEYFAQALAQQQGGQADSAIVLYEKAVAEGVESSELYNNLGLAYLQTQQLGKAILHFKKAVHRNPSNADARHNLQAAQQRISNPTPSGQAALLVRIWQELGEMLSANGWAMLFLLNLVALVAVWWRFRTQYIGQGGLVLLAVLVLALGMQRAAYESDCALGVLTKSQMSLRDAPSPQGGEVVVLHEGTSFTLLRSENDWLYIRLSDGTVGWLPNMAVERV